VTYYLPYSDVTLLKEWIRCNPMQVGYPLLLLSIVHPNETKIVAFS
jgi:hypothetical protein